MMGSTQYRILALYPQVIPVTRPRATPMKYPRNSSLKVYRVLIISISRSIQAMFIMLFRQGTNG